MNPVGCSKVQTAQPICGSRPGFKEPFGFSLLIKSILSMLPLSKKTLMKHSSYVQAWQKNVRRKLSGAKRVIKSARNNERNILLSSSRYTIATVLLVLLSSVTSIAVNSS
jgi:hypothetical protein